MMALRRRVSAGCCHSTCFVVVSILLIAQQCDAHGVLSNPRARGALKSQLAGVIPQVLSDAAAQDYCAHCLNGGGSGLLSSYGEWAPYDPLHGQRRLGVGPCGDPEGVEDHTKRGIYANPPDLQYTATYAPGSVANFEFDITTNHNGYFEFYLCDVANMPGGDISFDGFEENCYALDRVPHESCESGTDTECGPIDPKFPGRWVLPCPMQGQEQVVGGESGKMAYRIPDIEIESGVIQAYWLTQNRCNDPDGFMESYNYPPAWGNCVGDGGSVGGKPMHVSCTTPGLFPEEFWNCADIQVLRETESGPTVGSDDGTPSAVATSSGDLAFNDTSATSTQVSEVVQGLDSPQPDVANQSDEATQVTPDESLPLASELNSPGDMPASSPSDFQASSTPTLDPPSEPPSDDLDEMESCSQDWSPCSSSQPCCNELYQCGSYWGSSPMCFPKAFPSGQSSRP